VSASASGSKGRKRGGGRELRQGISRGGGEMEKEMQGIHDSNSKGRRRGGIHEDEV
jgi:hypothetical protein